MERIDALKTNYHDYMTTAPFNCDRELGRLPDADYDLTYALMTMLLREDYFCNGHLIIAIVPDRLSQSYNE